MIPGATTTNLGFPCDYEPVPASCETAASPGSREKLAVLRSRARNGEELFHESDRAINWQGEASGLVGNLSAGCRRSEY